MTRLVRLVLLLAAPAAPLSAQDPPVAYLNARVLPIEGEPIENGVLVVHNGRIVGVGPAGAVAVPENAVKLDGAGKTIMPGLVDTHSHVGGIGGADGSGPIQPDVRIYDSLNPLDSGFRRAVAGGLTTLNIMPGSGHLLSGQTVYVKLRKARTIEELMIRNDDGSPAGGIKMANGTNSMRDPPFPGTRGKSAALVRERFVAAQDYREKHARADGGRPPSAGSTGTVQPPSTSPSQPAEGGRPPSDPPARDIGLEALLEVIDGKRIVHHHTHRADDIMTVLRLRNEFGFRVVLHHVSEAWKMADEIAAAGVPCSVILVDSPGGKLEAAEMLFETCGILERAGVKVAIHTDDWINDSRFFFREAAIAVRAGMTRDGALRSLTIHGAQMLDLGDRVGSLEVGKDADFIVLSGDPLSVYTKVLETWVEGKKVFDRSVPADRLHAVGGFGAGRDQQPYFCCFGHEANEGGQ